MRTVYCYIVFFFSWFSLAQSNFEFDTVKEKSKIQFELINNLVVIPVEINGVELSFLLDTGVKETLLFNLTKVDSIELKNTKLLTIKGINDEEIKALKSKGNLLRINNLVSKDHVVYVALNQQEQLSSYLGKEIHGILGYHFFKDFVIEMYYQSQIIKVFPRNTFKNRWRSFEEVPVSFYKGKPFVNIKMNGKNELMLLDTGMSDSVWKLDVDVNSLQDYGYYEDFLGMSISGEVTGKRSKIKEIELIDTNFKDVKIAYPDRELLPKELLAHKERSGSIGGELIKRFNLVLDYYNKKAYLKPNKWINEPFYYNKTGIVLRQDTDAVELNNSNPLLKNLKESNFISFIDLTHLLSPEFIIDHVRKNSPADLVGLQEGDKLLEVNGTKTFRYKLKAINALFYDKDNKRLELKVERKGQKLNKVLYLKSPLIKNALAN